MKQQILEQEVRDLKAYIIKLENAIIQESRQVALTIIRERRKEA